MTLRTGLQALALSVAMVGSAGVAQAVTLAEGLWTSADGALSINQTFQVLGTLPAARDIPVFASISASSENPIDTSNEGYDAVLGVSVNGATFTSNVCMGGSFFCRSRPTYGASATLSPENMTLTLVAQASIFTFAQDGSFSGGLFTGGYNIQAMLPEGLSLIATPIPAALPLFASVLGVGGLLGYRRKRAQCRAAAAA